VDLQACDGLNIETTIESIYIFFDFILIEVVTDTRFNSAKNGPHREMCIDALSAYVAR